MYFPIIREELIELREVYGKCLNNCQHYDHFVRCPCYKKLRINDHGTKLYYEMKLIRRLFNIREFYGCFCFRYDEGADRLSKAETKAMVEIMNELLVSLDNLIMVFSLIDEIRLSVGELEYV